MATRFGIRKIAITGALSAVAVVLSMLNLGYILVSPQISITYLQVFAIIGAVVEGPVVGVIVGGIFGATSLVQAAISPAKGALDVFFTNPLISVLPRLFIGLSAWAAFKAFRGKAAPAASLVAGILGSLTNTVLVLGALVVAGAIPIALAGTVALTNGLIEAAAVGVIASAVVTAWKGIESRTGKAKLAEEE
jgi:uncharacterized membrane protein